MKDNKLQIYFVDKSKPNKDVSTFTIRCTGIREQAIGCIHAVGLQLPYNSPMEHEYIEKRRKFRNTSEALSVYVSEDYCDILKIAYSCAAELQDKIPLIILAIHELNPLPADTEVETYLDGRPISFYYARADGTLEECEIPTTPLVPGIIIYSKDGNQVARYTETTEMYYYKEPHSGITIIKAYGICEQGTYKADHVGEGIIGTHITIDYTSTYEE